jgi:Fe-S oxidoreductase
VSVAAEASRPIFWGLSPGLRIAWYVLALASVAVFAWGVARPILKWRKGKGGLWPPCPWRELPGRFRHGSKLVFSHAQIARRDRAAGWAHGAMFYGFLVLFIGTVILAFQTDFTQPVFGWSYFHGDFYLAYKEVVNLLGIVLIVGVLAMMVRRTVLPPAKLDYSSQLTTSGPELPSASSYRVGDWALVSILLIIAVTGFMLEGVRIAMDSPGYGATQFGGWIFAQMLGGLSLSTLSDLRHGLWWFHGLLAIAFVASIPYTKAAHMLVSFASTSLRDPLAGKRLPATPSGRESELAGYGTLADFSPLHLLQVDACTRCGKCHEACPANASGMPLSPRDVVLDLHALSKGATTGSGLGGALGQLVRSPAAGLDSMAVGENAVRAETVWSCMQCNACVEACPVGIEQAPIINQLRRRLVEDGDVHPKLQSTLRVIVKSGNSFGESRKRRGRWTQELDFEVKDARSEPVDVLWFVGDYASFDPRSQRVSRSVARVLHEAGVDFGILYDGELNSGNDVRRVGEEGIFESLAEQNIDTLTNDCAFNRIVTTDPHSLNTLRNEYPMLGGTWEVLHHTTLLLDLLVAGDLKMVNPIPRRVTYHDPCYLGRLNGGYDAPRKLLEAIGCTLVEMPRNRDNSFCCGAGGGRIWIPDDPGYERPSENRIREATGLPDVELFVVSCPKDVTMYEDAVKTSNSADLIQVVEISELIEQAVTTPAATVGA